MLDRLRGLLASEMPHQGQPHPPGGCPPRCPGRGWQGSSVGPRAQRSRAGPCVSVTDFSMENFAPDSSPPPSGGLGTQASRWGPEPLGPSQERPRRGRQGSGPGDQGPEQGPTGISIAPPGGYHASGHQCQGSRDRTTHPTHQTPTEEPLSPPALRTHRPPPEGGSGKIPERMGIHPGETE